MSIHIDSYCGLSCAECTFRESTGCGGCIATGGKPFHGRCDVAECAVGRKRAFCGDCADFPCNTLKSYSYDETHGDNGARIENVRRQKAMRVAEAREGIDPVGVCGHHCDHCFQGEWCGGCRSNYDCCSFAGACEDGKCPNKACAAERKIDGCHACAELPECRKGYFSVEDGYTAKAASTFVRMYGKAAFSAALNGAAKDGRDDKTIMRGSGSFDNAMKMLESYRNK